MQSELKKYQKHIILDALLSVLPTVLIVTLVLQSILLYMYGVLAALIGLIILSVVCGAIAKLYLTKKTENFLEIAKSLDSNFGDNDMIQTVIELNIPDDSLVQQELFEQAHIKLEPLYRKASISHIKNTERGKKVCGFAFIVFLILCLLTLFLSKGCESTKDSDSKQSSNKSQSKQGASKTTPGDPKNNEGKGKSDSGKGKGKPKAGKGNGKPKAGKNSKGKSKAGNSKSAKGKMGEKPNSSKQKGGKTSIKKQPQSQSKNKTSVQPKKKVPPKNTKNKVTPKKSKDWKTKSKGKWNKNSKGKSLGLGKVKGPLVDKRTLTTIDYLNSGDELITGVKKKTIPQKYKDKILKIYDEVRKSSERSKSALYPRKVIR